MNMVKAFIGRILRGAACYVGVFRPESLAKLAAWPLGKMNVRIPIMNFQHIGHLASEADSYIKEGLLGGRPKYFDVVVPYSTEIANPHLLGYMKQRLSVITHPGLAKALRLLSRVGGLEYDITEYSVIENGSSRTQVIYKEWHPRPPLWEVSEEDIQRGRGCLATMGVPEDAWFVCVHCREGGYYAGRHVTQRYRDNNVDNYVLAMREIVKLGGWCVRMGDPTMKKLSPVEGVIDYCHSDIRSDWMDVFLCGTCRFFLGSSSGLAQVANIFGVPVGTSNAAPMSVVLYGNPYDLAIPKLVWSRVEGRYLAFEEVLNSATGDFRYDHQYEEARIETRENSPEEIRDLAVEMLERAEGTAPYTDEDKFLQDRFISLMKPGHYSYGSGAGVGREFLRKYKDFLPVEDMN